MGANKSDKRVLLFIVEGSHDEAALALPLENLQKCHSSNRLIQLGFTGGDITTKYEARDVKKEIEKCADNYRKEYRLNKKDICQIVLLLDMDGAYIPDEAIIESDQHKKAFYNATTILHNRPELLIETHRYKCDRLETLLALDYVWNGVPFGIYFVSCNFDHVACGNANATNKGAVADNFADKYNKDADGLRAFFNDPSLMLGNTYKTSWDAIKQGLNSLQRHSNMNVFIDTHYPPNL